MKESFTEPTKVQVGVILPSYAYNSADTQEQKEKEISASQNIVSEVINDLESFQYLELNRRSGFLSLYCGEEVVDALYRDKRVIAVISEDTYFKDGVSMMKVNEKMKGKYYYELKNLFQAPKQLEILVSLVETEKYLNSDALEKTAISRKVMSDILAQFDESVYEIKQTGHFYFTLVTNETVADVLYLDKRVEYLNDAKLVSSQDQISIN